MNRRILALAAVLILAAWAMPAAGQGGAGGGPGAGGPPGGGFPGGDRGGFEKMQGRMEAMNALPIESLWAVLSFGVDASRAQLDSLRAPFAEAWNQRASILEGREKGDTDWDAIKDEFREMKKALDLEIKAVLSEEQQKACSKQMKALEKTMPRPPGGMGGGPMGGPPGR